MSQAPSGGRFKPSGVGVAVAAGVAAGNGVLVGGTGVAVGAAVAVGGGSVGGGVGDGPGKGGGIPQPTVSQAHTINASRNLAFRAAQTPRFGIAAPCPAMTYSPAFHKA
jgi:hypothetical protein